jgi:phospholipase D1/2
MTTTSIIDPQTNCWSTKHASRAAILIDGENYFGALYEAILNARQVIMILAWDIDSRMRLTRSEDGSDDHDLSEVLCRALEANPELHIYILNWDWAMLYSFEREWLPNYRTQWKNQSRLHFELDGECPTGSSQHQKVIVIDDSIAFCGGFDLGKDRWDTSLHSPNDPNRINPDQSSYPPFHDLQWLVEGDIAQQLGELTRERWHRVTNQHVAYCKKPAKSLWPDRVEPDFENVDINISLTFPKYQDYPAHREVEQLYLDSIKSANNLIYIENQYLSSQSIMTALIERLEEKDGPKVVLVLPKQTGGWLEQNTMDVLRARLIVKIHESDLHGHLRVCYPHQKALGDQYISVHSKTMIIDDHFLRVGSSNLSNRSMGFDSECDLSIEAKTTAESEKIKEIRERLLAEHSGLSVEQFRKELSKHNDLLALIDARADADDSLKPLHCEVDELVEQLLPDYQVIDPEKPLKAEDMALLLVPVKQQQSFKKQWLSAAAIIIFLIAMTLIWRFTPLADAITQDSISNLAAQIEKLPFSPVIILFCFALASVLAFPVTLLVIASVLTFGPWWGSFYALIGAIIGSLSGFAIGNFIGKSLIEKLTGSAISRLSKRISKHGILSVITVRIIPVAPFTIINLIAGASHIKLRDFFIGTVIGLLPGIITLTLFADSLIETIKHPDLSQVMILIGVMALVVLATFGLKKLFKSDNEHG